MDTSKRAVRSGRGTPHRIMMERVAALEAELHARRARVDRTGRPPRFGTWSIDLGTGALTWSEGARRIFGLGRDEPVTVERALLFHPDAARAAIGEARAAALASGAGHDLTVPFTDAAGKPGWVRVMGQIEADGGARRLAGIVEDVTAEAPAPGRAREPAPRGTLTEPGEPGDDRVLREVGAALRDGLILPVYQPIVDLRTGLVRGVEALARWDHPVRGILPPSEFAAALADPVLSVGIDEQVLRTALAQMRTWLDSGVPVAAVNVNVSEGQLRRPDLVEHVTALLAANRLGPEHLKLEVLETALLGRDTAQVARTVERLAGRGIVCVLDDFGTGYASLAHLREFRVERFKIDRSFVAAIVTDPFDRALTRSMIDLGRNLGIRVTAEGVETAEQLALLDEFGCDCAQGYLVGRPTAAAGLSDVVGRWHAGYAAGLRGPRRAVA